MHSNVTDITHQNLNLIQWNAKSIFSRFQELERWSTEYDYFAISETWLSGNIPFLLRGFDIIRKDRGDRRGGGVALLINHSLRYHQIDTYDCQGLIEACAAEVFLPNRSIILIACYRPPNSNTISEQEWLNFIGQFRNRPTIFARDFNAHCSYWGSRYTCPNGKNLWAALIDSEFSIIGNNSPTFCGNARSDPSVIDLTITHSSLLPKISRSVLYGYMG